MEREDLVIRRIEEVVTDVAEETESLVGKVKALIMRLRAVRQQAMAATIGEEEGTVKTEIDVRGEDLARIREAQINRRRRVLQTPRRRQPPQPRMITNSEAAQKRECSEIKRTRAARKNERPLPRSEIASGNNRLRAIRSVICHPQ